VGTELVRLPAGTDRRPRRGSRRRCGTGDRPGDHTVYRAGLLAQRDRQPTRTHYFAALGACGPAGVADGRSVEA
jgi:hypothetical protein